MHDNSNAPHYCEARRSAPFRYPEAADVALADRRDVGRVDRDVDLELEALDLVGAYHDSGVPGVVGSCSPSTSAGTARWLPPERVFRAHI